MLAGQSLRAHSMVFCATCDGAVHCWFIFCAPCDGAAHCWSWPVGHLVKVIWSLLFFFKRNHFSYDFAVGHWPANLLLTDDVVLLPPAIGPTLGASFVVTGFMPPLAEGWLLMHWAYGSVQRQKHRFDVDNGIFICWTWVWPSKTLRF